MISFQGFWSRYRTPFVLFLIVAFCAIAFRSVLLPFMVALFVAYLIDPVVAWVSNRTIRGARVPRGAAVLSVYAVVLSLLVGFIVIVGPQLGREVAGLAREVPRVVQDLRENQLPRLSEQLDRFVLSAPETEASVDVASTRVAQGIDDAENMAFSVATLPESAEIYRVSQGLSSVSLDQVEEVDESALFRFLPNEDGSWSVALAERDVWFEPDANGAWRLRSSSSVASGAERGGPLNLSQILDDNLARLSETSGAKFSEAVAFGQRLLTKLSAALLATFVTFMVAAFISIDVPNIIVFVRSLFPARDQEAVGELLSALNRGLSGVIRGQLLICLVNGVLTWVGLAILGVKFSFVLAVIAGCLSLIPVFGTIISTIPCVLIGTTQSFTTGLLVLAWILFIHFLEGNILNPKIIGSSAKIHPALVIFALLAGEHTFGIIGALLAVPIASIVQTLFLFFKDNRWREAKSHGLSLEGVDE